MNVIKTDIEGVLILEPRVFKILDESLGIDWKIPTTEAILSEKDTKHELLKDFDSPFSLDADLYSEFETLS